MSSWIRLNTNMIVKLENFIITGTILLFPFVVWDGLYSVTGLPKLLLLASSVFLLIFSSLIAPWKVSKREVVLLGSFWLLLMGILAWNMYFSVDVWSSVVGSLERSMWWITYTLIFLFVFLSFALAREMLTFRTLSQIFISVWVGLSLIALGQKYGIFGESFLGSMIFEGRAMSTIGQYNTFAALLILLLGLLLMRFLPTQEWRKKKTWLKNNILLLLLTSLFFLGIWTTGSRIALLGWVGLIFLFFTPERWRRYLLVWGILLGSIVFTFSGSFMSESGHASLESRKLLFSDALTEIRNFSLPEHILGRWFESIESSLLHQYSPKYLAYEQIGYIPDRSHSIFLDTYIQFGILGSIVFFLIFLIFPFLVFWKGESLVSRNIGLFLLIHFGVISVGFYDISNLFFASILIGFLYFWLSNDVQKVFSWFRYGFIFVSLLISLSSLYLLSRDAREQSSYTESQIHTDELLEIIETNTFPDGLMTWKRDDLISKVLAKKLDTTESSIATSPFHQICEKNSYYILQVCMRKAFLEWDFALLDDKVNKLLVLSPHDIVALSLDMELAKHEWNRQTEEQIAKKIISLFPSFVFAEDASISDYQKRKKEKIKAHYPIDDWLERAR